VPTHRTTGQPSRTKWRIDSRLLLQQNTANFNETEFHEFSAA
jgi:hypothetical protein